MAASIVSPTQQFQPIPNSSTTSMKRAALYARVKGGPSGTQLAPTPFVESLRLDLER